MLRVALADGVGCASEHARRHADRARRRADPRRLPDPRARGRHAPARVPRLGRHLPEAARGGGCRRRVLRHQQRERASRRAHARQRGHRRLRAGADPRRGVHRRSGRRASCFVRNTTEAINLVASSYATQLLEPGDRIVVTVMEHHSNLVPWQLAAERRGLHLASLDIDADGRLDLSNLDELLRRADAPRGDRSSVQRARHGQRHPRHHRARARGGRARVRRRGAVGAAHARSRHASSTATSSRSAGTRCAGRWGSACSGHGRSCSSACRRSSAAAA